MVNWESLLCPHENSYFIAWNDYVTFNLVCCCTRKTAQLICNLLKFVSFECQLIANYSKNCINYMRRCSCISVVSFVFLILLNFSAKTQVSKVTERYSQSWFNYYNQTRFSKSLGLWADLQYFTKEIYQINASQFEGRLGLIYYVTDDARASAGYAFINSFPAAGHLHISQPEYRVWQQFQWYTHYVKLRTMQWLRFEQRFVRKIKNDDSLAAGYTFSYRIRYNLFVTIPWARKGRLSKFGTAIGDEIYFSFGRQVNNNFFDQNRFFAGVFYRTSLSNNFQVGYLHEFQEKDPGKKYKAIDVLRFSFFHNLDLRKQ